MKRACALIVMGVLLLLGSPGLSVGQSKELVVAAWGGRHEEGWRKSLIPAFEKKYGAKVIWVPGLSGQTVAKLRAQKDSPQIDVAMMDDGPHRQAVTLGLVERIDRSRLTNVRELYGLAPEPEDYGIGFALTCGGLYYNTKVFAENRWVPPTSWLDLFRPELKGKVSVHSIANTNGLFLLLALNKAAGGTEANVDAGFAKMKELVPQVVTFDRLGDTATLIQQGTTVIGTWFIDSVANLAVTGVPVQFVFPTEGAWGAKEVITIVKGRPNVDLAYKFIDMLLSKEEQENTAKFVGLSPINREAKLDAELAKKMVYGAEYVSRLQVPNWTVINANRAAWTERWNKEIERR
jgi:putative spermidine/putrescine transport system substrate-binding protein